MAYDTLMPELIGIVTWVDDHLDANVHPDYQQQPLAQDWARVSKTVEEAGEAIDALIGVTGQNPRKGQYGSNEDLYDELCDVALTGLYALQHFTKDPDATLEALMARARYHKERIQAMPEFGGA
jgi:NTP pyrophosphatase (non-canonical NTP hydrolase)